MITYDPEKHQDQEQTRERLPEIVKLIQEKKESLQEIRPSFQNKLFSFVNRGAVGQFKNFGQKFWATEKCNQCRICERICPRTNIEMKDDKPMWQHNCELCLACIQWCPQEAIEYKGISQNRPRYHNAAVKVQELLLK